MVRAHNNKCEGANMLGSEGIKHYFSKVVNELILQSLVRMWTDLWWCELLRKWKGFNSMMSKRAIEDLSIWFLYFLLFFLSPQSCFGERGDVLMNSSSSLFIKRSTRHLYNENHLHIYRQQVKSTTLGDSHNGVALVIKAHTLVWSLWGVGVEEWVATW